MASMTMTLAAALLLPAVVLCQETQPVRSDSERHLDSDKKASCPSARKTRISMQRGKLTVTQVSGAVVFEAGMAIDADGAPNAYGPDDRGLDRLANARHHRRWVGVATDEKGHPLVQKKGPYRGFYVSITSLQNAEIRNEANPAKYVDARKISYIVLPPEMTERFGIELGDMAVVIHKASGKTAFAIFADTGPHGKIGEGSIALARKLALPSDPRTGFTEDGILYIVFPGSGLGPGKLRTRAEINRDAAEQYENWGGQEKLHSCALLPDSSRPAEAGSVSGSQD